MIFPTRLNIEMLAQSTSVASALEDTGNRKIVSVEPWVERRDEGKFLCIPKEAGYLISEEKMP